MKKFRLILAPAFFLYSSFGFAQIDYCLSLKDLLSEQTPNFTELSELRSQCSDQLERGSNAEFRKYMSRIDLSQAMHMAQLKRVEAHLNLIKRIREAMEPFSKAQSRTDGTQKNDSFLATVLVELRKVRSDYDIVSRKEFDQYLDINTKENLSRIRSIPAYELGIEALGLLSDLDAQMEVFQKKENGLLQSLDNKILQYLNFSENFISSFQFQSNYRSSQEAMKDYREALSPAVLKMRAKVAWGKFLVKAHITSILMKSEVDLRAGFIESGKEKILVVGQLIEKFLSRLPPVLTKQIREEDSLKKIIFQMESRLKSLNVLGGEQVDERQKEYLAYQRHLFMKVKAPCATKYPLFAEKLNRFEGETNQSLNSAAYESMDPQLRRFLRESLGNSFDTYIDLCREFVK